MIVAGNSNPVRQPCIPEGDPGTERSKTGDFLTFSETIASLGLSDIQHRAIELTIQGLRDVQIAQTLNINPKTVWHWKTQNEAYARALALARAHVHSTTVDRCENIAQQATVVLASILDESHETRDRLRAAHILLTTVAKFKPEKEKPQPKQQEQNYDDFPMPVLEPKVG